MAVRVEVNVDVIVEVNVGVLLEREVAVNSGVEVEVGIEVGRDMEVGDATGGGATVAGTRMPAPATVAVINRTVSILPTVAPSTDENKAGIFNHNIAMGPMVAASRGFPRATLMNFVSPSSLSDAIPNSLRRLSLFNARVFNSYAVSAGILTKMCTLPAVTFSSFN